MTLRLGALQLDREEEIEREVNLQEIADLRQEVAGDELENLVNAGKFVIVNFEEHKSEAVEIQEDRTRQTSRRRQRRSRPSRVRCGALQGGGRF